MIPSTCNNTMCKKKLSALSGDSGFYSTVDRFIIQLSCIYRARKIKPLSNKKTLDGIWFLILIIYVYTFDTCFNLLRCVQTEKYTNDFNTTESGH